jgi:hypothetical protein
MIKRVKDAILRCQPRETDLAKGVSERCKGLVELVHGLSPLFLEVS